MSRRVLTALALTITALASLATSQIEAGWRVGDITPTEAFALSLDEPELAHEVEIYLSAEVMEAPSIEQYLSVYSTVEVVEAGEDGAASEVSLAVYHEGVLVVEESVSPRIDGGSELIHINASPLLEACGVDACTEVFEVVITSDGDELLYGTWSAEASAHMPDPDGHSLPVPEGAELILTVL